VLSGQGFGVPKGWLVGMILSPPAFIFLEIRLTEFTLPLKINWLQDVPRADTQP
jgi:hypothetical protein